MNRKKSETKQREAYSEDSDEEGVEERDDEKPQVVVLKSGDLTQEEALVAEKLQKERDERELIESGKITFKPTNKRSKTVNSSLPLWLHSSLP